MLRMIDANLNRCREGIRVVEDCLRFELDSPYFKECREIRHRLKGLEKKLPNRERLSHRDSYEDTGKAVHSGEIERSDLWAIITANIKRAQESLRSLEEGLKLISSEASAMAKNIRYLVYELEKNLFLAQNKKLDLSLYLVTDSRHNKKPLEWVVEKAIEGGVSIVQLREKHLFDKEIFEIGKKVQAVCQKNRVPFLIDDRADICLALNADGIHIGQNDLSVAHVRKILGPSKIIGLSTHSPEQAEKALQQDVDYIAFGPLVKTPTKDYNPVGFEHISKIKAMAKKAGKPVVFIGGITCDSLDKISVYQPEAVAVVREIMCADNPALAASEIRKKLGINSKA